MSINRPRIGKWSSSKTGKEFNTQKMKCSYKMIKKHVVMEEEGTGITS